MWALILLAVLFGYGPGAVITARVMFGRLRSAFIASAATRRPAVAAVSVFERQERTQAALVALLTGLGWLLTVPLLVLRRAVATLVLSRPPVSARERELRTRALHDRIDELERSMAMGQHGPAAAPDERTAVA
jgi:hypothetical protein